jgi:hypothetical protein
MKVWPKSEAAHKALALIGATGIAVISSWLAFRLSFALFVRLYPHDGQDSLGSLGLAVFVLPIAGIVAFEMLYKLQRRL